MDDAKTEEKSPLLLYVLEKEENPSKNNKRFHFERGRLYGISSGATALFTEFPNYLSTCWLITVISSIAFFLIVMLTISSVNNYKTVTRVPRCVHRENTHLDNSTIHLVCDFTEWDERQIRILEQIRRGFPGFKLHLVVLHQTLNPSMELSTERHSLDINMIKTFKTTSTLIDHRNIATTLAQTKSGTTKNFTESATFKEMGPVKRGQPKFEESGYGLNAGVKRLLDMILRSRTNFNSSGIRSIETPTTHNPKKVMTIEQVLQQFPEVSVQNVTYEEAFYKTPLEKTWTRLNAKLRVFAVRIIQLWQYGGLSFELNNTVAKFSETSTNSDKLFRFISFGRETFEKLSYGVMTADDEGLHIFSKMPCHAFFGELIIQLKYAQSFETVKGIIKKSLRIFCQHSAVNKNYCDNFVPNDVLKI